MDAAGKMLLETADWFGLVVVNTMPGKCTGRPSRVQVRVDGTQESTLDYILCSADLAPKVVSMVIEQDQLGSDHRPCVLTLSGVRSVPASRRLIWQAHKRRAYTTTSIRGKWRRG